ncbi:flavodoxin family protein [Parasporobacterium paucivorans]|uniref:NADPH-dependent FMN reductase n=1 Tax=Parasporobacterium paucivorans DSM 15970 TaxID=1122934 RepID=A0A1M6FC95_9FIRM|nr:flavodoxin family protein [Parasporobacterium paucivorans]SHI95266.1 NADPH-dependent FMN reductase [Parasporobacterium paucivorans DSM 15970]
MKILGISGGTKNGNNDAMCKEALMGAKDMGAEVEFIRLNDLDIKHCTGCIACVKGLFGGKGGKCILKDDFDWLLGKMLDADGVVFSIPIFEKGATGLFRTITDRFGPRTDRGNNIIGTKIAEEMGGIAPDPRLLKDKVVSYMGVGGSDWATDIQLHCGIHALTPMWKVINNDVFKWSKGIMMNDEYLAQAHEIGQNIANAALDYEKAEYKSEEGVCPHCHSNNFFLDKDSAKAICCLCGIEGNMEIKDGKMTFVFPETQIAHAHDTLSGKFIHADDIRTNEGKLSESQKSDEYKARVAKYKEFIAATTPSK